MVTQLNDRAAGAGLLFVLVFFTGRARGTRNRERSNHSFPPLSRPRVLEKKPGAWCAGYFNYLSVLLQIGVMGRIFERAGFVYFSCKTKLTVATSSVRQIHTKLNKWGLVLTGVWMGLNAELSTGVKLEWDIRPQTYTSIRPKDMQITEVNHKKFYQCRYFLYPMAYSGNFTLRTPWQVNLFANNRTRFQ